LSGGLADREFGHWQKTLAPGDSFTTPTATLACIAGDLDALCACLTESQQAAADTRPAAEADLPIICNEFCTTWGNPTHENLEALAKRLQGSPVRYLVIDAGWYGDPGSEWWNQQGDWQPSGQRFPDGLAATAQMIRAHGLVPGLWFEFEVAGAGSAAFSLIDHQLKRDGVTITTTKRHFWDFRDPWVHDYLAEKVICLLRMGGFGYAKFDYNETIGIGCEGAESLGEGLRAHIEGVGRFFDRIRAELPELVIECCSSGGHRLEPSMIARSAMSSFSDAHESLEIPIIAANMHRAMLPRQSQIWAVLRKEDSPRRLVYSLSATFLGRMCLSGDLHDLSAEQWMLVEGAMEFYTRIAHLVKSGESRRFGSAVASYRHPEGWQAVRRISKTGNEALVIAHSFGNLSAPGRINVPLPAQRDWEISKMFSTGNTSAASFDNDLSVSFSGSFDACVIHLRSASG
jgi:alpha-galactosidase